MSKLLARKSVSGFVNAERKNVCCQTFVF